MAAPANTLTTTSAVGNQESAKKVTAPSAEERAVALWNELTESERATLIRVWDQLADEEIGQRSEASRPAGMPGGVLRMLWENGPRVPRFVHLGTYVSLQGDA
jgi:hypothetical protein